MVNINQIEREFLCGRITGATSQTSLPQMRRQFYSEYVGGSTSTTGIADLESQFLRKIIANNGGPVSKNYTENLGTLFEGFETFADWSVTGTGATIEDETNLVKSGSHSLKVTSVNNVSAYATKTVSLDLSEKDRFSCWVYIDDISKYSQSTVVLLYFRTDATNYYSCSINAVKKTNIIQVVNGWNFLNFRKEDFTVNNSPNWADINEIRIRALSASGQTQSLIIDDLRYHYYSKPKVIISFDDGADSVYSKAFAYMTTLGLHGVAFVPGDAAHIGAENYMTLANLQEIYADGWDVGNHGLTHTELDVLTEAEIITEVQGGQEVIESWGFTRRDCHKFLAYPNSAYNDLVISVCRNLGLRACRSGMNRNQNNIVNDFYQLSRRSIADTTTLAVAQGYVDETCAKGGVSIFNFHKIVDSAPDSVSWLTADFNSLMDYIKTKKDQGALDVVTISEWYDGLTPNINYLGDLYINALLTLGVNPAKYENENKILLYQNLP